MLATLSFSLMGIAVKWTSARIDPGFIVFFRSITGLLILIPLMLLNRSPFRGKSCPKLLILRGLTGFIALALHFQAIKLLPLGTAMLLNSTAPLFVSVLAIVYLKEKPEKITFLILLLSFLGLYLLADVAQFFSWKGFVLGVVSGFFAAVAYTSIRAIGHQEKSLTIMFYFAFISLLGSFIVLHMPTEALTGSVIVGLSMVALGAFAGQFFLTHALQLAPSSLISPFMYLTPVFSTFWGYLIWRDPLTVRIILGMSLVICGGVILSARQGRYLPSAPPDDSLED